MTENAIEIDGISKRYRGFTLEPVRLEVPKGAIFGLIGSNGAGKTTLMETIFGLVRPDGGKLRVYGFDHRTDEVAVKSRCAYAGPGVDYSPWKTVGKAARFLRNFYPRWDDGYLESLLLNLGITANRRVDELSFGEKTKLSLALALAWRPEVLVLDEPTLGLDALAKKYLFSELLAAVESGERAVFLSSHHLADVERYTDHIGLLHDGSLLLSGSTNDVVDRFELVDIECENIRHFAAKSGVTIVGGGNGRWRLLVEVNQIESLEFPAGGSGGVISRGAVTLEEVFVALAGPQVEEAA